MAASWWCHAHFQGAKLKLRYRAFCWCIVCFSTSNGFFRILKGAGFRKWLPHLVLKIRYKFIFYLQTKGGRRLSYEDDFWYLWNFSRKVFLFNQKLQLNLLSPTKSIQCKSSKTIKKNSWNQCCDIFKTMETMLKTTIWRRKQRKKKDSKNRVFVCYGYISCQILQGRYT